MRKMWKWMLSMLMLLILCACGGSVPQLPSGSAIIGGSAVVPDDATLSEPYIGLVLKARDNPFFTQIQTGAETAADALGAQLMTASPLHETDAAEQETLIHTMAGMAVDILIADPIGDADLTEALMLAHENGKQIIAVDTEMDFPACACYVGTDNILAARQLGAYAAALVEPDASVYILRGPENDNTHTLRTTGLQCALTDAGLSNIQILSCPTDAEQAQNYITALLMHEAPPALICATADSLALGAVEAVQKADLSVHIVSFDGMSEVTECILDGTIDAAIAQDAAAIGAACIETSIALFQGLPIERTIYVPCTLITSENAEEHLHALSEPTEYKMITKLKTFCE